MDASEQLAEALRERNVPATARDSGGQTSRRLNVNAAVLPLSASTEEVLLRLELVDSTGQRLGLESRRHELPLGSWQAGQAAAVSPVLEEAASAVAAMIQPPEIKEALVPGFPGARVVVLPLDGLPGDGERSLGGALRSELTAAGLPVVEEIGEDDLLIAGEMDLAPRGDGFEDVTVTWRVLRAKDGEILGEIEQANQIPEHSLDGPWGLTARAIAQGAVYGIVQLIDELDQSAG